jgi:hypothetical protein
MNKELSKIAIEEATCSDVGSLLEIRKVFIKFSKYIIDFDPKLTSMKENEYETLRALIEQGNKYTKKKDTHLEDKYIIGINPSFNKETKKFDFCSCSTGDIDILLSLIQLVKEPIEWNNLSLSFNEVEIIEWCEKYTLPGSFPKDLEFFNTEQTKFLYNYIRLDEFYIKVTELYLLFKLWYEMSIDDNSKARKYALKLAERLDNYEVNDEISFNILLSVFIDAELKSTHMRFRNFGINKLYLDTDNIYSMCFFQLSNIVTKPLESKKHLKICKGCHAIYWGHGNSSYCNKCDRRTIWSREKRKSTK